MILIHQLISFTRVGVLCNTSRQSLETLKDWELQQLMEDLPTGHHTLQAACTPQKSQPTPWGKPLGSSNFNENDQEVTFPRGGGWVPPRQLTPAPVQPDEEWVPQDHLLSLQGLLQQIWMWGDSLIH